MTAVHHRPASDRKRRSAAASWTTAAEKLGVDWIPDRKGLWPVMRGTVENHAVQVEVIGNKRAQTSLRTKYTVAYRVADAPSFIVTKRFSSQQRSVATEHPRFDAAVVVETDDPDAFVDFLTAGRAEAIVELLRQNPVAQITNADISLKTNGVEPSADRLIDSVRRMVGVAQVLQAVVPATPAHLAAPSLNEAAVLDDLFNSDRNLDGIATRFDRVYKNKEVCWSGEVLGRGWIDRTGLRIAVLIGSADGTDPDSGRVVAMATVSPSTVSGPGDVVTFKGHLLNVDGRKRYFHVGPLR